MCVSTSTCVTARGAALPVCQLSRRSRASRRPAPPARPRVARQRPPTHSARPRPRRNLQSPAATQHVLVLYFSVRHHLRRGGPHFHAYEHWARPPAASTRGFT